MTRTATPRRSTLVIVWLSLGVIVIICASVGWSLPVAHFVTLLKAWLGSLGVWGPVVFVLLYVTATLVFMPVVVLTVTAGVLFGPQVGTLTVSLASTISAAVTFLIARHLAREKVARWIQGHPRLRAIDKALGHASWKIVVLLRLSTVLPFSVQNYLYGLTPIGFWPYLVSSWLAMLPGTFMYAYIGHATAAAVTGPRGPVAAEWIALGIGLAATVVASLYVTALTKKELGVPRVTVNKASLRDLY